MSDGLVVAIIVMSLVAAAWCLVAAAANRPVTMAHLLGLAVVELAVLVQVAVAVRGAGAAPSPATFIGYLVAAALILPAAAALAYLEPTRWGAVITGAAALVLPVLMLRLVQVSGG